MVISAKGAPVLTIRVKPVVFLIGLTQAAAELCRCHECEYLLLENKSGQYDDDNYRNHPNGNFR